MINVLADISDTLTKDNFPGIALLSVSGLIGMTFVVKWMVRFQREFTNFYVEENHKLRSRIDGLEEEVISKDKKISDQHRKMVQLELESSRRIAELEHTVEDHERTIKKLTDIIDRRKLD